MKTKGLSIKSFWDWLGKNKEKANIVSTVMLIIVTLLLIGVTIYSSIIASNLGKIEVQLEGERQKQKLMEKIILSDNLKSELETNNRILRSFILELESHKNLTDTPIDNIEITRIVQATQMFDFGNAVINQKLSHYLINIKLIKADLSEITLAQRTNDQKIKSERIDHLLSASKEIVSILGLDDLIRNIDDYRNETIKKYSELDTKSHNDLADLMETYN